MISQGGLKFKGAWNSFQTQVRSGLGIYQECLPPVCANISEMDSSHIVSSNPPPPCRG